MSGLNEKLYWLKRCRACDEIMPAYEKVCYCTGSIKLVREGEEQKARAAQYKRRKEIKGFK